MNKKLIYTVITNSYDKIRPVRIYPGFDYWLFTDNPNIDPKGWELKLIEKDSNPLVQQRLIKINSHEFTKGYDLTIYFDGNFEIIKDPNELLTSHFSGGFLTSRHPKRGGVVEEGKEILRKRKDTIERVQTIFSFSEKVGYKDDLGLYETGFIARDKSQEVIRLEKKWSEILKSTSHRDQLSLPLASFVSGVQVNTIPREVTFRYLKFNRGHNFSLKFNSFPLKKGLLNKMCVSIKSSFQFLLITIKKFKFFLFLFTTFFHF
jgi:hypothetical protein